MARFWFVMASAAALLSGAPLYAQDGATRLVVEPFELRGFDGVVTPRARFPESRRGSCAASRTRTLTTVYSSSRSSAAFRAALPPRDPSGSMTAAFS